MHYRLYMLGRDGRIVRGIDLDCATDAAALTVAAEQDHAHGLELWKGGEFLMRRDASDAPAPILATPAPAHFLTRCQASYAGGIGDIDG